MQFWNVEILLHFNVTFSSFPLSVLLVFARHLMGKLNFFAYISFMLLPYS